MKAQLKIQEMAFVLLALVLLAGMAFIFFMTVQKSNLEKESENIKQQMVISILDRFANMQEIGCSANAICIDEDKAEIIKKYQSDLKGSFQGVKNIEIVKIYPSNGKIVPYSIGEGNQSYSTYVNLCKQEKLVSSFQWDCGLALLKVEY